MKIKEIISQFRGDLSSRYSPEEIENFIFFSMNDYLGYTRRHLQLKAEQELKPAESDRFLEILKDLKNGRPIQYILGNTEFYGLKIRLNEHVLIPRPETEELVELILQRLNSDPRKKPLHLLDLCTGSGCIAIALKKHLPEDEVTALDISDEALLVAKGNAILNHALIHFIQGDILSPIPDNVAGAGQYDVIVSNPPYVLESEKKAMSPTVVQYEPALALFVPDQDPLIFYKAIAGFAVKHLAPDGTLYFEINQQYGHAVTQKLEELKFKNIELLKDMSGNPRFVTARHPLRKG